MHFDRAATCPRVAGLPRLRLSDGERGEGIGGCGTGAMVLPLYLSEEGSLELRQVNVQLGSRPFRYAGYDRGGRRIMALLVDACASH